MFTSKKFEMGIFELNLLRTDTIPIVNYAWTKLFARIETNKNAARERGWDPLNRILLSHPDIISSNPSALTVNENGTNNLSSIISTKCNERFNSSHENDGSDNKKVHINELSITNGFAGKTLCTILQKLQRDIQTLKNFKSSRDNGRTFL